LESADSLALHVSGSVTLNAFGSLIATGTLDLSQGQVSDATVGSNANALSFKLTSGQLFAGVGGVLSGSSIDTSNATGFSGGVDTLTITSISHTGQSWLGVDA